MEIKVCENSVSTPVVAVLLFSCSEFLPCEEAEFLSFSKFAKLLINKMIRFIYIANNRSSSRTFCLEQVD